VPRTGALDDDGQLVGKRILGAFEVKPNLEHRGGGPDTGPAESQDGSMEH
jgi:hypothetical protein